MTVSNPRIDVKDAVNGGWFGAREEAQLPVRAHGANPQMVGNQPAIFSSDARVWMRRARRAVIDVAMILAAMTALPVAFVALNHADDWRSSMGVDNTRVKVASTESLRSLMVAIDPSITPLEAGKAYAALQPPRGYSSEFPMRQIAYRGMPWQRLKIPASLMPSTRPYESNAPNSQTIMQSAAKGFTTEELAYLRELAVAPVWAEFDRVARARSMDEVGGRFVLPFTAHAAIRDMPIGSFTTMKELAFAAVSRAAYHLAIGQRDSAETILRSIVSFGFNVSDNGAGMIDQLVGRVIVNIGRSSLENYYTVTHDRRLATAQSGNGVDAASMVPIPEDAQYAGSSSIGDMRHELISRAENPRESQGIRFASLELLQTSMCTNVRELLFGQRADVTDAFRRAKIDLARFPSQQALIDLMQRSPETDPIVGLGSAAPLRRFLYGTSAIAGTVLRNPRLAACMWKVTEGKFGF